MKVILIKIKFFIKAFFHFCEGFLKFLQIKDFLGAKVVNIRTHKLRASHCETNNIGNTLKQDKTLFHNGFIKKKIDKQYDFLAMLSISIWFSKC